MRNWRAALLALLLASGLSAAGDGLCLDQADKQALDLMDFAVKQTVKETGVEVIGVGSWTSQKKYKGPLSGGTSDHDMRVVLAGENNTTVATKKWKDFQEKLRENITASGQAKRLSDTEINKLINSTNVYPPGQIMQAVENADDAKKLFSRAGAKPNLGDAPVEGLWGKGSKTYTHYYEEKSGKLFFVDDKSGKVMTGGTDLTHLVEGAEAHTTAGEVNKARQWAEKVIEQIEEGNIDKVAKQAERLRTSVNKARGLERLGTRVDYLDDIVSGKVTDPEAIRAAVARAKQEAGLLLSLAEETNVKTRGMLRNVLTTEAGEFSKMGKVFWKYADKVPVAQLFRAFQLYGYYATVKDISAMTGADFNSAVLNAYAKELGWMAGPLSGLAMELADTTLQAARQGAYNIVSAFQDCEDLVTGIHSVKGREELNKGMSIDQMVSTFIDTSDGRERLRNFVWYQARQASARLENNVWVEDANIQNTLYQKCYNPVVAMWKEKRVEKISAFNQIFHEFDKMATASKAVISIDPYGDPVPLREQTKEGKIARVTISGATSQDQPRMLDLVKRMNALLAPLEGGKGEVLFASLGYELSLDGKGHPKGYAPVHLPLSFKEPGDHVASLSIDMNVTGTFVSDDLTQQALLQGYRKQYTSAATFPFSVVEDASRVRLRVDGPGKAKIGQSFQLIAVIEESQVPAKAIQIAWGSVTSGQRLVNGYTDRVTRAEQTAGRYQYLAEAFAMEHERMVRLGDARGVVDVVTDEPQKPQGPGFLDMLGNIAQELQKQTAQPPVVKKPEPAKPEPPKPQVAEKPVEKKQVASTGSGQQKDLAENEALCDCVNRYLTGPRTEEQRRSYNKWCTDKERCKGTEIFLKEPFKYNREGNYCWGYEECREHNYDPATKQASTRTCGSFSGAYYIYQAKEMCAKVK
jgi:hypothetical protein